MRISSRIAIAAIVLGVVAILMSIGAVLALLDIVQGEEPNLTLEWVVVWMALAVMVIAQVVSIVAILGLSLRRRPADGADARPETTTSNH